MFLEISRNYVPIIITIIRNITVLVSQNVICLEYFITMSHSIFFFIYIYIKIVIVLKEGSSNCLPTLLPLTRFSPSLFVVLQEILYQPSFLLRSDY